jgi:transposase
MEVMIERCAGLDVHQATVVACVRISERGKRVRREVRTFGTMTHDLEALRDWLVGHGVTHVGMESTSVYWRPVHAVLEGHATLIVGNARHIRNVPGRKTDVKDAEWIADLVAHGLIGPSFVRPAPLRQLRELTRYRRKLTELQAAERNRLQMILESANIKLASVATDVLGVSGRDMLRALIKGQDGPEAMANLARGRLRKKRGELAQALHGRMDEAQRFLLKMQLQRVGQAEQQIEQLDRCIAERLEPYRAEMPLLMQIPGVDWVGAAVLVAEMGLDMKVFLSVHHLAAWAGVCPASNEGAGKRRSVGVRHGNKHLRTALYEAAMAGSRTKGSYFRDKYHRLKARRGAKRAALAIAHKILVAAYHMLTRRVDYHELGERRTAKNLRRRLEQLGYHVTMVPKRPSDNTADAADQAA